MSAKAKAETKPCACCATFHNPKICSQCRVAGCDVTLGQKGHKCRLQGTLLHAMTLSPFQLQQRVAELEKSVADLTVENRRLVGIVLDTPEARIKLEGPLLRKTA
jgi:hypothetical protein